MLGLGETHDEVVDVMRDLREVGVELLTLGQYLRPSAEHLPVSAFIEPDEFAELARIGRRLGFSGVASAPFVRSSYHAAELLD
jgi:lipoic acid synthetase